MPVLVEHLASAACACSSSSVGQFGSVGQAVLAQHPQDGVVLVALGRLAVRGFSMEGRHLLVRGEAAAREDERARARAGRVREVVRCGAAVVQREVEEMRGHVWQGAVVAVVLAEVAEGVGRGQPLALQQIGRRGEGVQGSQLAGQCMAGGRPRLRHPGGQLLTGWVRVTAGTGLRLRL